MNAQKLVVKKKIVTVAIVEESGEIVLHEIETTQKERYTEKQARELFPDAKKVSILSTENRKYDLTVDGNLIEQVMNEQYPEPEKQEERGENE